ncbi:FAD-dependent oxidoreductase [Rhizobium sp. 18065]|uniref:FAD-dependent oxidoreductase n=1 Tax=Rhizobium sp. 18065 TaxID=2681411 RepID=UPI00135B3D4F|nr:FAD-dependent oxidoreductase [Rhizobium sp. 18065]
MTEPDVVVIGGGPAGLAAAIEVARSGYRAEVVEQRESLGGAIHRQPIEGVVPISQAAGPKARWLALADAFSAARIPVRHASVFLGVDGDGLVLIENRRTGLIEQLRPKAVILATGAVEKVYPRPGWQIAGVSTAGALQVMMKETGRVPQGRILLAGSGPLLIAVAAQMTRLGNPPVALVEAGDPLRRMGPGFAMLGHVALLREAVGYLSDVYLRRIVWMRGTQLVAIDRHGENLQAVLQRRDGSQHQITVDRIGLHDGIRPNDFGLPTEKTDTTSGPLIVRAGDCREALGAFAAEVDGRHAGRSVADLLSGNRDGAELGREIKRARMAQATLAALFAPIHGVPQLSSLPDETLLCRCEGKTVGDLRRLCNQPDRLSGREVKHNGRFAMGACQGRFCAANTAALMAELKPGKPGPSPEDLTGRRWPVRPVSIAALTGAIPTNTENK